MFRFQNPSCSPLVLITIVIFFGSNMAVLGINLKLSKNNDETIVSTADIPTFNQVYYWDFCQVDKFSSFHNFDFWKTFKVMKDSGEMTIEFSEESNGFALDNHKQISDITYTPDKWYIHWKNYISSPVNVRYDNSFMYFNKEKDSR